MYCKRKFGGNRYDKQDSKKCSVKTVRQELDSYMNPAHRLQSILQNQSSPEVIETLETEETKKFSFLRKHGLYTPLVKVCETFLHFIAVLLLLFVGAIVFSAIEDPIKDGSKTGVTNVNKSVKNGNPSNANFKYIENKTFWKELKKKYGIDVKKGKRDLLLDDVSSFLLVDRSIKEQIAYEIDHRDRNFVLLKWFYFVSIATTTIGFGDVYPRTAMGKVFLIFYLIIGIVLMITFLIAFGKVYHCANIRIFDCFNNYTCRRKKYVSEELMTVISLVIQFLAWIIFGIWYIKKLQEMEWTLLDTLYYIVVTLTTIGFGDILHPLKFEIQHVYKHFFYRIFGLTLFVSVIYGFDVYLQYRHDRRRKRRCSAKINSELRKLFLMQTDENCRTLNKYDVRKKMLRC